MRPSVLLSGIFVFAAMPAEARVGATISLGAAVLAVAAGPSAIIAATERAIVLLDANGVVIRRFEVAGEPARRKGRRAAPDSFAAGAGVPTDDDFDEPYDTDSEIEDAENLTLPWQRATRGTTRTVTDAGPERSAVVVAIDGRFAWWGLPAGLWRVELDGENPTRVLAAATRGVGALASSPAGTHVAVESDGFVFRSSDHGTTFLPLFSASGEVKGLSMTAAGTLFVLDEAGLWRVRSDATTPERAGPADVEAVAGCGDETLTMTAGQLVTLNEGGGQDRRGVVPADSTRLACATDGSLVVALGSQLWVSHDGGRTGMLRADLPVVAAGSVSVGANVVWAASSRGLWLLPAVDAGRGPPRAEADRAPPSSARLARIPNAPWWLAALPRVDLGFATARSSRRHDVRAFILLTFAFDRNAASALERQRLMASLASREPVIPTVKSTVSDRVVPEARLDADPRDAIRTEETQALSRIEERSP